MCSICKTKSPVVWVSSMKRKEKIIAYTWVASLTVIILLGVLLCYQRPPESVIKANRSLIAMSDKIRRYYQNRPDYWGLNTNEVVRQNLYSGTLNNNSIINELGKPVVVGADSEGNPVMPGGRSFMIGYRNLSTDECVELASFRWNEEDKLGLLSLTIQNAEGTFEFSWGDKGLPVSRSRAKHYCKTDSKIMWSFE